MEINNFRIGNLVEYEEEGVIRTGKIFALTEDGQIWFSEALVKVDIKAVIPIKLTTEWLYNIGMPEEGSTRDLLFYFGLFLERRNDKLYIISSQDKEDKKEVEFVHQAQNVYFILTGKELDVNPVYSSPLKLF